MGAYHGWGLGSGTRRPVRGQLVAGRTLALVADASRDVGRRPVAVPRAAVPARRAKRST
jgi:hypothetical protein